MMKKQILLSLIPQQGILPLFFNKDEQVSIELMKALYSAGIRAIEYTNRGEAALANFKAMKASGKPNAIQNTVKAGAAKEQSNDPALNYLNRLADKANKS
jgi:2-keto-3-deoxy-6-phosphogluconate aldolase